MTVQIRDQDPIEKFYFLGGSLDKCCRPAAKIPSISPVTGLPMMQYWHEFSRNGMILRETYNITVITEGLALCRFFTLEKLPGFTP